MTKFAIKTQDGRYIKMAADVVEANEQQLAQHGTIHVGGILATAAYNYKTQEQAERALKMINEYVRQSVRTQAEREAMKKDWRYTKYVDAQVGCYIEQL
jgi:hypothetical protein